MRSKEASTRIIYVRHGQTDFPLDRIYNDDAEDPQLNAAGVEQARHAAGLLHKTKVDLICGSPSNRAWATAQAIAQTTSAPLEANTALKERRFGIWDGLFFDEIERNYPDLYQQWKQNPSAFKPEGGESVYDLLDRVKAVIDGLIEQHKGKTIVVVSHVGPIRVCLTAALQMPVELYRQLTIDYASLSRVDYGRSQNNFVYMNISSKGLG